ncbi:hypothetical protein LTR28_008357, partial [Elasticomyces elasticus]
LSTFFSTLDLVDTSGDRQPQNAHSLPLPGDISAAFRTLADAFGMMRGGDHAQADSSNELLSTLVESLMQSAEHPPREVEGVPDSFLEELDRVPKKQLKETDSCPICSNPFLEGMLPPPPLTTYLSQENVLK